MARCRACQRVPVYPPTPPRPARPQRHAVWLTPPLCCTVRSIRKSGAGAAHRSGEICAVRGRVPGGTSREHAFCAPAPSPRLHVCGQRGREQRAARVANVPGRSCNPRHPAPAMHYPHDIRLAGLARLDCQKRRVAKLFDARAKIRRNRGRNARQGRRAGQNPGALCSEEHVAWARALPTRGTCDVVQHTMVVPATARTSDACLVTNRPGLYPFLLWACC